MKRYVLIDKDNNLISKAGLIVSDKRTAIEGFKSYLSDQGFTCLPGYNKSIIAIDNINDVKYFKLREV